MHVWAVIMDWMKVETRSVSQRGSCQIRLGHVSKSFLKNPSDRKPDGTDGRGFQGTAGKREQTDGDVDSLNHRVIFELPVGERRDQKEDSKAGEDPEPWCIRRL